MVGRRLSAAQLAPKADRTALAAADKRRAPENREALIKEFAAAGAKLTHDEMVARNCAVTA
jgi:8-hydroxy-5-deazaflavin:NADPH oxidoreductase